MSRSKEEEEREKKIYQRERNIAYTESVSIAHLLTRKHTHTQKLFNKMKITRTFFWCVAHNEVNKTNNHTIAQYTIFEWSSQWLIMRLFYSFRGYKL